MSDVFLSEILVLTLLFFPAIRPFSERLKSTAAISLFPLFSLIITVFIVLGQGLFFSLLPVIFITLICIITEFARFVMMLRDVPNNFYTIPSIILRIFIVLLIISGIFSTVYFSPEREVDCSMADAEKLPLELNIQDKLISSGVQFFSNQKKNNDYHILILNNFANSNENGNSITRYFLNENYNVTELSNFDLEKSAKKFSFSIKRRKQFKKALNEYFANLGLAEKKEAQAINQEKFNLIISKTLTSIKEERLKHGLTNDCPIYVFCEGELNKNLYAYSLSNPFDFAKIFFLSSEEDASDFQSTIRAKNNAGAFFVLDERETLKFPKEKKKLPYCLFIQRKEKLPNYADLRGDDVLAAYCLGSNRDLGREDRIFVAQIFEKTFF